MARREHACCFCCRLLPLLPLPLPLPPPPPPLPLPLLPPPLLPPPLLLLPPLLPPPPPLLLPLHIEPSCFCWLLMGGEAATLFGAARAQLDVLTTWPA